MLVELPPQDQSAASDELLQARNYADAYNNFLSAAYHADHPFGNWSGGYANTLSFVATLYPSWRAARIRPAEALRYD